MTRVEGPLKVPAERQESWNHENQLYGTDPICVQGTQVQSWQSVTLECTSIQS